MGNTSPPLLFSVSSSVHPHACGEHVLYLSPLMICSGSSPRMWGTHLPGLLKCRPIRFIPTHVGNTPLLRPRRIRRPVHPHACGEHSSTIRKHATRIGSSPRMWGTLQAVQTGLSGVRFIPTHVGNTMRGRVRAGLASVHPHACGEHRTEYMKMRRSRGSSPRMWGTPKMKKI